MILYSIYNPFRHFILSKVTPTVSSLIDISFFTTSININIIFGVPLSSFVAELE